MWRRVVNVNVVGQIKVDMKPVGAIMKRLGVTAHGDVQQFHTANVRRRIWKYMPRRSGAMIKLMIVQSPEDEPFIHVDVPYAHFQYEGKVWIYPPTGSTWAPKYGMKEKTDRDLIYDQSKNPEACSHWDRALVAAEGAVMQQDLQDYVNRRAGR